MRYLFATIASLSLAACSGVYYETMEKVGYHKREILVDRVADARESQEEAKEQFKSALEHFQSVVRFDGGDLEELYEELSAEFEHSEARADAVRERIDDVRDVAGALFDEWEEELDQYADRDLRERSRDKLEETQRRYSRLIRAMERAEARLDPVLANFRDQVLYLKHNLNARAVSSLRDELTVIEADVDDLIEAMNRSIAEAEAFMADFEA